MEGSLFSVYSTNSLGARRSFEPVFLRGQLYLSPTMKLLVFCLLRQKLWDCVNQMLCGRLLAYYPWYCFAELLPIHPQLNPLTVLRWL